MGQIENENNQTHIDSALNMLTTIMQKITAVMLDSDSTKPEFYNELTGVAISLTDAINQVENGAAPLRSVQLEDPQEMEII